VLGFFIARYLASIGNIIAFNGFNNDFSRYNARIN